MKNASSCVAATILIVCCSWSSTYSQSGSIVGGTLAIADRFVTLNGGFSNLRQIEVVSAGNYLSLEDDGGPVSFFDTSPFVSGWVIANGPDRVAIGATFASAGAEVQGSAATRIGYSGPPAGIATDLQLNVKVGLCDYVTVPFGATVDFTCEKVPLPIVAIDPDAFFSVTDGRVALHGNIRELSSVQVQSPHGGLSVGDGGALFAASETAPFQGGTVTVDHPRHVVLGVLDQRITVEGLTKTSILYWQSQEVAADDLTLNLGVGDDDPQSMEVDAVLGDGAIAFDLDRPVVGLGGIEAISPGGYLSLASQLVPFPGLESVAPFSSGNGSVAIDLANEILIQSTRDGGRTVSGLTPTSIAYDGTPSTFGDLVVTITTSDGQTATLSLVPEPNASDLAAIACVGLLVLRKRFNCRL